MKTLIAYFTAENGTTARAAKEAAEILGADLFAITPEQPYTAADLNWKNPLARCNREKLGRKDVPVAGNVEDFEQCDTVLLGFPIWYGAALDVPEEWSLCLAAGNAGIRRRSSHRPILPYAGGDQPHP